VPRHDRFGAGERRRELEAVRRAEGITVDWREDHDASADPCLAELSPFLDRRDAEAPGVHRLEGTRDRDRSEPVRVRLHHRKERHARSGRDRDGITLQRAEVDVDPGACQSALH
jgi:hypothetical protein